MPSREAGEAAERQALDYLMQQGLKLVAEVRMRKSNDFGGAAASITHAKQARLIKTANHYLTQFSRPPPCRFDAVLLGAPNPGTIEWVKNAFDAQ
jgi:putative endonuclease